MSNTVEVHAMLLAASMASAVYAHADNAEEANKRNNPRHLANQNSPLSKQRLQHRRNSRPQFTLFAGINVTFRK